MNLTRTTLLSEDPDYCAKSYFNMCSLSYSDCEKAMHNLYLSLRFHLGIQDWSLAVNAPASYMRRSWLVAVTKIYASAAPFTTAHTGSHSVTWTQEMTYDWNGHVQSQIGSQLCTTWMYTMWRTGNSPRTSTRRLVIIDFVPVNQIIIPHWFIVILLWTLVVHSCASAKCLLKPIEGLYVRTIKH